jgi:hypothetical protein
MATDCCPAVAPLPGVALQRSISRNPLPPPPLPLALVTEETEERESTENNCTNEQKNCGYGKKDDSTQAEFL